MQLTNCDRYRGAMSEERSAESFESFRKSFSYGSRSDLNFKFFKGLSNDEVAAFLQTLLHHLGDSYDTGDIQPLIDAAYAAQIAGYVPGSDSPSPRPTDPEGPFAPFHTSVANAKVGMLTTFALISQVTGIKKGSSTPNTDLVADMSFEDLIGIAKKKRPGIYAKTLKSATSEVLGSCHSAGVTVDGRPAGEVQEAIRAGEYDSQLAE